MKKRTLKTRLYLMYALALIPLLLFGLYKNGLSLFIKRQVGILGLMKPLLILGTSLLGSLLGGLASSWMKTKTINKESIDDLKGNIIEALLLACILPIDTSIIAILLVTFLVSFLAKKMSLNKVALMYLAIQVINALVGCHNFLNVYQMNTVLNYDGYDLFFGSGVGGLASTNIFLIILGLIFLSNNRLYKKEVVYTSLITFLAFCTIPLMLKGDYQDILPHIFGYNYLFSLIFIAPNLYSSSYTVKGQVTNGLIIGILTVIFSFIIPYEAAGLAILITSLLKSPLDKMFIKKLKKEK